MHHAPVPDFPVSTPVMILWVLLLLALTAGFVLSLVRLNRKGHRKAIVAIFGLLLVAGTAIHVDLLALSSHTVTSGNWIQLVLVSMVAGLEMFIGHTVIFDDIIAAVIFVICLVRDRNAAVNIYLYAILRVCQTLLGVFSAWLVNTLLLPYPGKDAN